MNLLQAAILGIVEGITEYLPVSSTGHLISASSLLGLDRPPETKRAVDAFEIVIQGGAILAVLGLYWPRVRQMIAGLLGRDPAGLRLFTNLVIAFIPAAFVGLALHHWIEEHLFFPVPVMAALAAGGVVMILIGRWQRRAFDETDGTGSRAFRAIDDLTPREAIIIGLLQCISLWPGTSRSMTTIVGGMLVGMKPRQAAEFSFLLGLPTLGAACLYSGFKNFRGHEPNMLQTLGSGPIVVGILVATVCAAIAVKWLVAFLNHHGLAAFGWYRLMLCAVLAALIWRGVVNIAPAPQAPSATTQSAPR